MTPDGYGMGGSSLRTESQLLKSLVDQRFDSRRHRPSASLRLGEPISHCRAAIELLNTVE